MMLGFNVLHPAQFASNTFLVGISNPHPEGKLSDIHYLVNSKPKIETF